MIQLTPQDGPDAAALAPRVLIVDGDVGQRRLMCEAMRSAWADRPLAHVAGVGGGRAALARDLSSLDVVLLDYDLPDMTGLEALERLRAACDVPVVIVTGENTRATAREALRLGACDYVLKLGNYLFTLPLVVEKTIRQHRLQQENLRLRQELTARLAELAQKNTALEDVLRQLRELASTDHLTGLANRRAFADMLERHYNEARRYGFDLSCLMCDLDRYKELNDALGHQAGDRILVLAADVIRSNLRGTDRAARYGGDEFVLLLPHTGCERAAHVAQRIRQQLAAMLADTPGLAMAPAGGRLGGGQVSMSVGIASLLSHRAASADILLAMADDALYRAKERGKDRVEVYGQASSAAPTAA